MVLSEGYDRKSFDFSSIGLSLFRKKYHAEINCSLPQPDSLKSWDALGDSKQRVIDSLRAVQDHIRPWSRKAEGWLTIKHIMGQWYEFGPFEAWHGLEGLQHLPRKFICRRPLHPIWKSRRIAVIWKNQRTNLNSSQTALATLISTSSRINTSHPTGNLMTEKPWVRRRESWHFIYRISASPVQ